MKIYTKTKVIRISEDQLKTLQKMKQSKQKSLVESTVQTIIGLATTKAD